MAKVRIRMKHQPAERFEIDYSENECKNIEVLILDDFGLRNDSLDEAIILVDCLEERYQQGCAIIP